MNSIEVTRTIHAPLDRVFQVISDIRNFQLAVPHIINIEFLTEQRVGLGTRFRETRRMNGREHETELEVTEFEVNERIRMVADAGGTVWDSLFTVSQKPQHVQLAMKMDARPHTWIARITTPLIRGMVLQGVEADMDAVREYCEAGVDEVA